MAADNRVSRIESLTDEQRATFPEWEAKWLAHGLRTGELTEDEWAVVADAALKAAAFSNLPEPVLIRAGSPLAAHIAASIAAFVAPAAARHFGVESGVWSGVGSGVWSGVGSGVRSGVGSDAWSGVWSGVGSGVWSGVGSGVWSGVGSGVRSGVGSDAWSGVESGVESGVRSGVWSGVGSGVWSGVGSGGSVLDADQEWLHEPIQLGLRHAATTWSAAWVGGNTWASDLAFLSWFRDVGNLDLAGDLWDRYAAYEGICSAGPSAWHRFGDFAVAAFSDRPTELHLDAQGRSHREDGAAIVYADGWALNVWHGISVPDDFFTWDNERALAEENSEIRRCAIERIGWENVTDRLTLVASAPDPGNEPHEIRLYDLPADMQVYDDRARILVVENASLDKGGHRRTFGLPVPARHSDPIAAAADLFGIPVAAYRSLVRAS